MIVRESRLRPKVVAPLMAAGLVVGVMSLLPLKTDAQFQNQTCFFQGQNCLDCDAPWVPDEGCTAPIPKTWQPGGCREGAGVCNIWNYNCGELYTCKTEIPRQIPCGAVQLCRNF